MRGRALGLDLGTRRIGVAICDQERSVATPLETIERVGDRRLEHERVSALVDEHDVAVVVVGLPLSLSGGVGPTARAVLSEVKGLRKRIAAEVVTHDERMTTVSAEASLRAQGVSSRRGRAVVDQVAAAVILQSWIDGDR
ncbi:MAG: Holliday junction resolvase RuvX [Acidimicrobiia bacterium]|nr:Holliday junction resolvase RuvX [Acidimicrobiia bacterium]